MAIQSYEVSQIAKKLENTPEWLHLDNYLHRTFTFSNFVEAFAFMTKVALLCERQNHHPEWSNIYNKVTINLRTHECNGISERDFSLAKDINSVFLV